MVIKRTKRLPEKGQQHGPALLKVGKGQLRENTKDVYKQGSHHKKDQGTTVPCLLQLTHYYAIATFSFVWQTYSQNKCFWDIP